MERFKRCMAFFYIPSFSFLRQRIGFPDVIANFLFNPDGKPCIKISIRTIYWLRNLNCQQNELFHRFFLQKSPDHLDLIRHIDEFCRNMKSFLQKFI